MNLNKTKEEIQVFSLIMISLAAGFIACFMFFLKPQLKKAADLKKKIEDVQPQIRKTRQHMQSRDKLDISIKALQKKAEDFEALMPKGDESWSIEQLDQIAKRHNVTIKKIQPELPGGKDAKPYFANDRRYDVRTVSVDVMCGYHSFGVFLNALERSSPFLKVNNIMITAGNDPDYQHRISFAVSYLVLKEIE